MTRGDLETNLYKALQDKSCIRFDDRIRTLVEKEDGMHVTFKSGLQETYDIVI